MRSRIEVQAPGGFPPCVVRTALDELGLPQRASNALRFAGVGSLDEVADWWLRDLQSLPQVGPAALSVLREALRARGLELQPSLRRKRL